MQMTQDQAGNGRQNQALGIKGNRVQLQLWVPKTHSLTTSWTEGSVLDEALVLLDPPFWTDGSS